MCKFIKIYPLSLTSLRYIPKILNCYQKYSKYLRDDFASEDMEFIFSKLRYLWVILTAQEKFMGFAFLDNWVSGKNVNYSAEITTCFEKEAWGSFTRYSAKFFLKYCFDVFGLTKIQALIYPDNYRVSKLLKSSGFKYETNLPSATLRGGKPQDINIYALYRDYYYKNEVKNEQ